MVHYMHKGLLAVVGLALIQAVLRLYFAVSMAGLLGSGAESQVRKMIEMSMSDAFWTTTAMIFFILGAAGMVTAFGLMAMSSLGFYGTIALSVVTIIYDAWAMISIQSSAVLGIVLPAVFVIYLLAMRGKFGLEVSKHEGIGGVRN